MDIRITDHDDIWIDGKQYVSLEKANRLAQEAGAIDYDRIQSIVENNVKSILAATNNTIGAFLGVPEITVDELRAFCKKSNLAICDQTALDERLASQYRLGYNEGAKDAGERFKVLKAELLKKFETGVEDWVAHHSLEFSPSNFPLVRAGITVGKQTLEALLKDNPKADGCGWVD